MRRLNFLALDQALQKTGWAYFDNGELVDYGCFNIDSSSPIGRRLAIFWDHLGKLHQEHEFEEVVFEGIQNQNNNETYKKLAYVQAAIMLWCYYKNIDYEILAPSEWRSKLNYTFGKKREEQKANAINYVKDMINKEVTSDEADAICIGFAFKK